MTEKKKNIKVLTKGFWALSRPRQESFLKELYALSNQNKDLFSVRLGGDNKLVFESLIKNIQKETTKRIGRYRKLRLSKINQILKNADKYAFPMYQQIELKKEAWTGMLSFIMSKKYIPERYQIACARHLDQYLSMVKLHVLETSEKEEIYIKEKAFLENIIATRHHLPHIEDVYLKYFLFDSSKEK